MRSKFKAVSVAAAAMVLLMTGQAAADAPSVTISSPTNGTTINSASYPYNLTVAGTVTHTNGVVKLSVEVNGVEAYDDQWTNVTNQAWSFGYSVLAPGTYTIVAYAEHGQDTDDANSVVEVVNQTVTIDYPAAPAVANGLLNGSNVKGKDRQGCVSRVALEMGPGTEFMGVEKDEAGYEAQVDGFMDGNCPGY